MEIRSLACVDLPVHKIREDGVIFDRLGRAKKGTQYEHHHRGYAMIQILDPVTGKKRGHLIHRLVAMVFVDNPSPEVFTEVRHKDNNKRNNHYTNLEWYSNPICRAYEVGSS